MEHPLRTRALAAGVVDRRDLGRVAQRRDDQRVVGDRGADDDRHTLRDELLEAADDFVLAPGRQAARVACDELERTVEAARRRDLVEAELQRVLERAVALREVVEQADADRRDTPLAIERTYPVG